MSATDDHQELQRRLGHAFASPSLLRRALTHRSFGADHNERLEFLGDAVLSAAISGLLFRQFEGSDEGDLTRVRAHLVRQDTLHRLALAMELPAAMRLSEGESRSGGAQRPSILADALEAVIGAVYLDGGFEPARALVERLFEPLVSKTVAGAWTKDPKTELQEWLQGRKLPLPEYSVESTRGKPHEQILTVRCHIATHNLSTQGEGRSRRAAEQAAAEAALDLLRKTP